MIGKLLQMGRAQDLRARALRGTGMTVIRVGGGNVMRLASNLILTRLLFPEAFGLMALVQVFIFGLQTFSDIGIHTMLIQSKREDRTFINTLWTIQIIRGFLIWGIACALATPAAWIYDQPMLAYLLPVTGFAMVVRGFKTTREAEARRVLKLERVIAVELGAHFIGLVIITLLAWWWQSVWALAIGTVLMTALGVLGMHVFVPGQRNRLCWDYQVFMETLKFGAFLFFSSITTFFNAMGAQMILGAYIPVGMFGIYNIAKQLGAVPGEMALLVARNVIFPLYRMKPPAQSAQNQVNVFKARRLVALFAIGITIVVALIGDWVVIILFDPTYELAGPILVLMALALLPTHAFIGVHESLSGSGDSRRFFYLSLARAVVQMALLVVFVPQWGIVAAILLPSLAILCVYPYQAMLTHRYKAWDIKGEGGLLIFGLLVAGAITWIKWDVLRPLFE